jgi:hypothetical protein
MSRMVRETRFLPTEGREGVILMKVLVNTSLPPFLRSATSATLRRRGPGQMSRTSRTILRTGQAVMERHGNEAMPTWMNWLVP